MGVLDDAIREHLELKRRHGASDEEIAQAEAEALGPARREPAGDLLADDDLLQGGAETELLHPDVETIPADSAEPVEDLPELEPVVQEPAAPLASLDEPTEVHVPADVLDDDPLQPPDSALAPGEDEAPAVEPASAPDEREAVEPPAPSTRPHGDPATGGDELEPDEVPADERLSQSAPLPPHDEVHDPPAPALPPDDAGEPPSDEPRGEDRLWFEKKPQRDFDFDD